MKMRMQLSLAALAAMFAWTTSAHAALLLDDTWTDGSRTQTSLPTESAAYASAAASVAVAPGSLSYTQGTGSQRLHTHFAAAGSPVTLGVGQQLIATVNFFGRDGMSSATGRNFRVGLFSDPDGTQVTTDGYSDGGGSGNPYANARGYAAFFPLSTAPGTTQIFQIGKRTGSGNSLLGSAGDFTQAMSGGGIVTAAGDTLYTLAILLTRATSTQMNVTFRLSDSSGVLGSQTVVDSTNAMGDATSDLGTAGPYLNFDTLAFRFSSNAATANRIEFTRFRVEVVPEPGSAALASLGGLAALAFRRQR